LLKQEKICGVPVDKSAVLAEKDWVGGKKKGFRVMKMVYFGKGIL
jgi:hypothetical protein